MSLKNLTPFCTVPGCRNRQLSRGYCAKHYQQMRRHGEIRTKRTCSVDKCENKHHARGFCKFHYDRMREQDVRATDQI